MTLLTREEIIAMAWPAEPMRPRKPIPAGVDRAVLAIQPSGLEAERQASIILAYLDENGYVLVGIARRHPAEAALGMIVGGLADVVVAAFDCRIGGVSAVEDLIAEAGGRLEYVREPARRLRRDVAELARKMLAKGLDVGTVAELLDIAPSTLSGALGASVDPRLSRTRRPVRKRE